MNIENAKSNIISLKSKKIKQLNNFNELQV